MCSWVCTCLVFLESILVHRLCGESLLSHAQCSGLPVSVQAHAQGILGRSKTSDIKDGCEPCLDVVVARTRQFYGQVVSCLTKVTKSVWAGLLLCVIHYSLARIRFPVHKANLDIVVNTQFHRAITGTTSLMVSIRQHSTSPESQLCAITATSQVTPKHSVAHASQTSSSAETQLHSWQQLQRQLSMESGSWTQEHPATSALTRTA